MSWIEDLCTSEKRRLEKEIANMEKSSTSCDVILKTAMDVNSLYHGMCYTDGKQMAQLLIAKDKEMESNCIEKCSSCTSEDLFEEKRCTDRWGLNSCPKVDTKHRQIKRSLK
jgi:hypothetical protein